MRQPHLLKQSATLLTGVLSMALLPLLLASCGSINDTTYPARLIGANGQTPFLEDLEKIINDTNLTDEEKLDALRDLGIEDEKLLEGLLGL